MKKELSPKQRTAAVILSSGLSAKDASKQLGVSEATIHNWLRQDQFLTYITELVDQTARAAAPHALNVLTKQLDDGNPWVAQGASREVLRMAKEASGAAAATVTVTFAGMPMPGMPEGGSDD